jgi:renalase
MNSEARIESCLVIGAGVAGLLAARRLQENGVRVTVLDKGRGVGGRMATRRFDEGVCDHGAQFLTVRDERFGALLNELRAAGVVREWSKGFPDDRGTLTPDGNPRYCGSGGMNAIARHLAAGLTVHCGETVTALNVEDGRWKVTTASGLSRTAEALVLTPPVPQSLALLDAGNFVLPALIRGELETITYDPCLAVVALLDGPSRIPEPGGVKITQPPIAWIADNRRKGISPAASTITIHTTPDFAREHWDAPHEEIARMIFNKAERWLGANVRNWQVHRWRYSQPVVTQAASFRMPCLLPCLLVNSAPPVVFAGDGFGGPRVEGAAVSGWAAAETLLADGRANQ